jgi:hypothetical protein
MVVETVMVLGKGVIIMNNVWNIKDSRTTLGWGVLIDGSNRNVLSGVRGMTIYGKNMLKG